MKEENYPIDFVIPWVDDSDPDWKSEKDKYWAQSGREINKDANSPARFRDWDNLKYWFRAVEKFAPWVNKIYFVTNGQCPKWLNTSNPKLELVTHRDYIPEKYLPVFQANPIEDNFHRISNLSEHFVYFNDDMFLTSPVKPSDFFKNGFPREMAVQYSLVNGKNDDTFNHMLLSMCGQINGCFNLKQSIRKNLRKWYNLSYGKYLLNNLLMCRNWAMSGIIIPHTPSSLRKSTINTVWDKIPEKMDETSSHRFREMNDITQYIFRYWEIMSGTFYPTNIFKYSREFHIDGKDNSEICNSIINQKYKMICINDCIDVADVSNTILEVNAAFEKILPEKSAFEL